MAKRIPTPATRAICLAGIMVCAQSAEIPAMVVRPVSRTGFQRERVMEIARSGMLISFPEAFNSWYRAIMWIP